MQMAKRIILLLVLLLYTTAWGSEEKEIKDLKQIDKKLEAGRPLYKAAKPGF